MHIRWFFGVIGLLNRPLSIFRSCELIRYLAIAVMRWFPLMCKIYGSTQKYFFTNAYVRSLLELSISFLHCCVNIPTIDSLNESMNLFVSPIFCDSQVWSSPVRSRTERIREHQFVKNIGIQMSRKELSKTIMIIPNLGQTLWSLGLHTNISGLSGLSRHSFNPGV